MKYILKRNLIAYISLTIYFSSNSNSSKFFKSLETCFNDLSIYSHVTVLPHITLHFTIKLQKL